ncbi:MAG: hypothetical protein HOP03_03210 [Lysobacter sp.]|nr:hypothetical protein [Lysobacter sp.]
MRKGVVIALCVAVVAVGAAVAGWWMGRDRASSDRTGSAATQAKSASPAELAVRAERSRQFVEEHRHLWREASYIEIRQAAEGGNLVAQRRLSELYEDCKAFDGALRSSLDMLRNLAKTDQLSQPTIQLLLHDYNRLCTQAAADLRKNSGLAQYWLHKSAKAGDVTSEMRYFARTVPTLSPTQFRYFVDKVSASGDPDAMFELSLLVPKLKGDWPDPEQAPAFKGQAAQFAWIMASCRAGYDCARGSRLMHLLCISDFACGDPNYERYLSVSSHYDAQRPQVEKLIRTINDSILAPKAK